METDLALGMLISGAIDKAWISAIVMSEDSPTVAEIRKSIP